MFMKKRVLCFLLATIFALLCFPSAWAAVIDSSTLYSIKTFGAMGDGITDDTAAIQAAIDSVSKNYGYGTVFIPEGEYVITKQIALKSNVNIKGTGPKSVLILRNITDTYFQAFMATSQKNIHISNFRGVNECPNTYALWTHFLMSENCTVENLIAEVSGIGSSQGNKEIRSKNIAFKNNTMYGNALGGAYFGLTGISFSFTTGGIATGNRIEYCAHGINWWGGDSNTVVDGAPENERCAQNIVIANNVIEHVGGGGIWGSMGQNIVITNNVVNDAHDVGIDLEGTYDTIVSNNVVKDGYNGGLTTFFFCRGITFSGNTVYNSTPNTCGFKVYNSAQDIKNEDITVIGNTFVNTSEGTGVVGGDNCEKIIYANNNFINVRMDHDFNNSRFTKVDSNHFVFDRPITGSKTAVEVGSTHRSGECIFQNNLVESLVEQPEEVIGVFVAQSDNSSKTNNIIEGNIIKGFSTDIWLNNTAIRQKHVYAVDNNIFGSGNLKVDDTTVTTYQDNFRTDGGYLFAGIPGGGTYQTGQVIYFRTPDVENAIGAVCIEGGAPGKWKLFGFLKDGAQ